MRSCRRLFSSLLDWRPTTSQRSRIVFVVVVGLGVSSKFFNPSPRLPSSNRINWNKLIFISSSFQCDSSKTKNEGRDKTWISLFRPKNKSADRPPSFRLSLVRGHSSGLWERIASQSASHWSVSPELSHANDKLQNKRYLVASYNYRLDIDRQRQHYSQTPTYLPIYLPTCTIVRRHLVVVRLADATIPLWFHFSNDSRVVRPVST